MTKITMIAAVLGLAMSAQAAGPAPVDEPVRRWRQFMDDVYALHRRLIAGRAVQVTRSVGGYARHPGYFRDEVYTDGVTGRVITRLQRVSQTPAQLHSIEVFIHDRRGRVVRDYSARYLPDARNAPWSATVSLYAYPHDGLTAFRSFDADDYPVQEVCRGRHRGKDVDIALDEFDRLREERKPGGGVLGSPLYRLCFRDLPLKSAGRYLKPQ